VLEADLPEVGQQSPVLSQHKAREQKLFLVKLGSKKESFHCLVAVMVGEMVPCFKKSKYENVGIFKPNAPLANVVGNLGKLSKGLAKQDHIVIVKGRKQPGPKLLLLNRLPNKLMN
jgi:hypothetical protein